jgi:hypothetical protein
MCSQENRRRGRRLLANSVQIDQVVLNRGFPFVLRLAYRGQLYKRCSEMSKGSWITTPLGRRDQRPDGIIVSGRTLGTLSARTLRSSHNRRRARVKPNDQPRLYKLRLIPEASAAKLHANRSAGNSNSDTAARMSWYVRVFCEQSWVL